MSAAHALAGKLWMNPQCGKLELAVHEFDEALEKWTAEDGDALRFDLKVATYQALTQLGPSP